VDASGHRRTVLPRSDTRQRWQSPPVLGFGTKTRKQVKSSYPGASLAKLPCGLHVNVVQQEVQQRGRTTARMHDRGEHRLAAEISKSSQAPVVRIERVTLVRLIVRGG